MKKYHLAVFAALLAFSFCSTADGRFLQTDPVGYQDSLNPYLYVQNDPADRTDPSGLLAGDDKVSDELAKTQVQYAKENPEAAMAMGAAGMGVAAAPIAIAAAPAALAAAPTIAAVANVGADIALGDALGGASATAAVSAMAITGARTEAAAARAAGAEGGAAGAVATSDGKVFAGRSARAGGPGGATNPKVQQALDKVPSAQQSRYHGQCCEINALSHAFNLGADVRGGASAAVRATGPNAGSMMAPCSSCSSVLDQLGITPVMPQ